MYKLITCDLDETLLNDEHNISKENLQAIKAASKLGVKFVPTTGRGYNSVRNTLEKLGLADQEQEYVISYNGGAITENKENGCCTLTEFPLNWLKSFIVGDCSIMLISMYIQRIWFISIVFGPMISPIYLNGCQLPKFLIKIWIF